jgi:hypothetical protein
MSASWFYPRAIEVPCTVEIADTSEEFHAHVLLEGFEVGPGDSVLVHEAPTGVEFGQRVVCDRRATVLRAAWFGRFWTRLTSRFELTLLYEVSFSPDHIPVTRHLRTQAPCQEKLASGGRSRRPFDAIEAQ